MVWDGDITDKTTEYGDHAYQYDAVDQLLSADNPEEAGLIDEAYTYDAVNNRLTSAGVTGDWSYNDNNELTGYDNVSYEYDAGGNMIQKTVGTEITSYEYTVDNRLAKVWDGEAGTGTRMAEYGYDPFGRRLWKEVDGARTCFLYSDEGLIGEYDAAGNEIKTYGWRPGGLWGTNPLFLKQGGSYYWYLNNYQGTPQKLVASSGLVVWEARYDSFGNAQVTESGVTSNLRLPGQYYDGESGLHYNWNRYYDPGTGRYLTPDQIGLAGGINLYAYVLNDPVNLIDPFGLCSDDDDGWLDSVGDWLLQHGNVSLSFDAGTGVIGATGQISITNSGISGNVGVGWGVGFGASATVGASIGESSGWGVTIGASGGNGVVGATASETISQGSTSADVGVGWGVGVGGSVTVGYGGSIWSW